MFVHELGHFLVAKAAGVRVDEFGFGYPPRALKIGERWGTIFSLNWIPFGGFVKIFGENYEDGLEEPGSQKIIGKNFTQVSKKWQALILAAGVTFNILFAWLLFSLGFVIGLPTSVDNDFGAEVKNPVLTITGLTEESPAQKSGLKTGDKIMGLSQADGKTLQALSLENVSAFIDKSSGPVNLQIDRGGEVLTFQILPETGIVESRKVIGISMDMVGTLSLPMHRAIYEGGRTTLRLSSLTIQGIAALIGSAVIGKADISQVAGPVGIISLVGDASRLGFAYLITFAALISINLAIINLVPFPALDGGRILFVAIEGTTKKKINPKAAHILNTAGFFLLIIIMLIITYRDILRLF